MKNKLHRFSPVAIYIMNLGKTTVVLAIPIILFAVEMTDIFMSTLPQNLYIILEFQD